MTRCAVFDRFPAGGDWPATGKQVSFRVEGKESSSTVDPDDWETAAAPVRNAVITGIEPVASDVGAARRPKRDRAQGGREGQLASA